MPSGPLFVHAPTSGPQNHVPVTVAPRPHTPTLALHPHPSSPSPSASASMASSSSGALFSSGRRVYGKDSVETRGSALQYVAPYSDVDYLAEKSESAHNEYASVQVYEHTRPMADEGLGEVHGGRRDRTGEGGAGSAGGGLRARFGAKGRETGRLGRALIIGWVGTTVVFVLATAIWKGQLFRALDRMSTRLREMGYAGQAIFAFLIFLTTIPPLPLYSTLMVLSGYTFGARTGFAISYAASLVGAVTVFVVSRTLLRDRITKCLADSPTSMSLLSILPSKPHLLLLIRIAPYPFNLLNVVLASSPMLTLGMYAGTTAVSLLKVILHTWFGSGIHDISEMHAHDTEHGIMSGEESVRDKAKVYSTWAGVVLCLVLVVYLHHVARRALGRAQDEAEQEARNEAGEAGEGLVSVRIEG